MAGLDDRDDRTIFVGNLDRSCTEVILYELFVQVRVLVMCIVQQWVYAMLVQCWAVIVLDWALPSSTKYILPIHTWTRQPVDIATIGHKLTAVAMIETDTNVILDSKNLVVIYVFFLSYMINNGTMFVLNNTSCRKTI